MFDERGMIVDFREVLSIDDPVVRNVVESCVIGGLAGVPHRQFRLTPRAMALLFDQGAVPAVTDVLRRLQQQLRLTHSGHVDWKLYDLAKDGKLFRGECRKAVESERLAGHDEASLDPDSHRLGALLHVIDALHTIDVAAHIRHQPVVRIAAGQRRRTEFEEHWIDLAELEHSIGLPIRNDSWKFSHVTEFLDFKVLNYLTRDWTGDHAISVNFHCINVVAPRFNEFLFRLPAASRPNLIFELSVSEFLHDRAQVSGAAIKLRNDGFRVAIDGVAVAILDQVTEFFPEVHYVKMPWSEALTRLSADQKKQLKEVIGASKEGTFVLSRCGRAEDVEIGQALGFTAFQGWGVAAAEAIEVKPITITPPAHPVEEEEPAPQKPRGLFDRLRSI